MLAVADWAFGYDVHCSPIAFDMALTAQLSLHRSSTLVVLAPRGRQIVASHCITRNHPGPTSARNHRFVSPFSRLHSSHRLVVTSI